MTAGHGAQSQATRCRSVLIDEIVNAEAKKKEQPNPDKGCLLATKSSDLLLNMSRLSFAGLFFFESDGPEAGHGLLSRSTRLGVQAATQE